jgi:succinate dehydrogenase / fumarate reductase iron-sulfur subunit
VKFVLNIWRQADTGSEGGFERHEVDEIDPDASMLEMLDVLNERIVAGGGSAISFDHDCREGICGSCDLLIDGIPQGPGQVTACQV